MEEFISWYHAATAGPAGGAQISRPGKSGGNQPVEDALTVYFDGRGVSKEDREAFMKTPTLLQFKAAGNAGTMDFSGGEGLNLTALCAVLHPDCPVPFACTVLNVSGCSLGGSEGGIEALVSLLEKNSTITKVRQLMLSTSTSYFLVTSILTPLPCLCRT